MMSEHNRLKMSFLWFISSVYLFSIIKGSVGSVTLSPTSLILPVGNSEVAYTLSTTSNVGDTCEVTFPDGQAERFIVTEINTSPFNFIIIHNFNTPNIYTVVGSCSGVNGSATTTLNVKTFGLDDLTFSHTSPLTANYTQAITVPFQFTLFDIQVPPSNVLLTWDFGDGITLTSVPFTSWTTWHTYEERGEYEGTVTVTRDQESEEVTFIQQTGILKFTTTNFVLKVTEIWSYTAEGISPDDDSSVLPITCDFGDGTTSPSTITTHTFPDDNYYYPIITGTNITYTEYVGLDRPVIVENIIVSGSLKPLLVSSKIIWPPGDLEFTISLPAGSKRLFFLECVFDFRDDIDRAIYTRIYNLTVNNPIVYKYHYFTLGQHQFSYTCSKQLSSETGTLDIEVINTCVSNNGIFDRQYSNVSKPMRIYTSDIVDLASRLTVFCINKGPKYVWAMFEIVNNTEVFFPITQPGGDAIQFPIGSVPAGMYRVNLNVSFALLPYSHFDESTFIEFREPPLRAEIVGGSVVSGSFEQHEINAKDVSYDPLVEIGMEDPNITFSWECSRVAVTSIEDLQMTYHNESVPVYCGNIAANLVDGVLMFDASDLTQPEGFVFKVTVGKPNRISDSFTQLFLVEGGTPKMNLRCIINCELKTAVTSDYSIDVYCPTCSEDEIFEATYTWNMVYITMPGSNSGVANFSEVPNFRDNVIYTGDNPSSLVLKRDFIVPGDAYSINVRVDIPGRILSGFTSTTITTNLPPYGGSCYVTPTSGTATETKFQIICADWKDEGFRSGYNASLDADEPITYKYLIEKNGVTLPLMDGVESTSPEMDLPLFPGTNGTDYILLVRVYDILQDYAEVSLDITLESPVNNLVNQSGALQVEALFQNKETDLKEVNGSSSTVRFSRTLNSVVSAIQSVPLPHDPLLIDQTGGINQIQPNWQELWDDFNRPRDLSTQTAVANKSGDIMKEMKNRRNSLSDMNGQGVTAVAECLANVMNNPESTTLDTAIQGADITLAASDRLNGVLQRRPFPVKERIDDVVYGMTGMMDKVINTLTPNLKGQVAEINTDNMRELVARQGTGGDEVSPAEAAFIAQRIATAQSLELEKKKNATRNVINGMEQSIEKSHDALVKSLVTGQAAKTIKRGNMLLRAQKLMSGDLAKQDIEAGGFTLNLPSANTTGLGRNEAVDIQATVFTRNPFSWGANGTSYDIESPVVTLKLKCPNGTDAPKMPVSLKLKSANPPTFKSFNTEDTLKGPYGMHYHTFILRKRVDSSLIFLSAPNNTGNVTAYFRVENTPKLRHFDYKTEAEPVVLRGEPMFRLFVPSGTLEPGTVVFGLLFGQEPNPTDPEVNNRRRRSIYSNDTDDGNSTALTSYNLVTNTDGCRVWDKEKEYWDDQSCKVSPYSTVDETICECEDPPGLTFGTAFYSPPNTIDFTTVFAKFDLSNAAVYGTILAILFIYVLLLIWARRRDRRDKEKWRIGYLKDNLRQDKYFYLLTVETGLSKNSGTRSNVFFVLTASKSDSGVRTLSDGERFLETGSVMTFVMTTDVDLDGMVYLRIWHDNSGGRLNSWLFNKMIVEDLQTRKRAVFYCNRWLSAHRDDGLIDRIIPVSGKVDLKLTRLFTEHARNNVTDNHLWLSVFLRPNRSTFTRVQRISCCLSLLFLTMIVSAMFFRSSNETTDEETVKSEIVLGPLRFSASTIFVSVVSLLITVPPSVLIVYLFRSSRPRRQKQQLKQLQETRSPTPINTTKLATEDRATTKLATEDKENPDVKTVNPDIGNTVSYAEALEHDIMDAMDQEKPLPYGCIFIAWFLVFLAVSVSAFFLILYSMQWGKSISEEFITAFLLSFFENILLSDPIKVAAIAFAFAVLLRNPYMKQQKLDLSVLQTEAEKRARDSDDLNIELPPPVSDDVLQRARRRHEQESKAYGVFVEIVIYTLFILALFIIGYGNRDTLSYQFKHHMETRLFTNRFDKIINRTHFMAWTKYNLLPEAFATYNFNGGVLNWREKLFFSDMANFRVGPLRIRQIRTKERPAPDLGILFGNRFGGLLGNRSYYWSYTGDHEDTNDYCIGWKTPPCSIVDKATSITVPAWEYTSSGESWGLPVTGNIDIYGGGGYFFDMDINYDASVNMFNQLYDYLWIDRQTRAVFVEFSLYNADSNLLVVVRIIAEFPEYGGAVKWHHINTLRIFQHVTAMGFFVIACEIVVFIIMIILTVMAVKKIKKEKWNYFKDFWHIIDVLSIIITIFGFTIFVLKEVYLSRTLSRFKENPKKFVNFEHVVWFDFAFVVAVAFLLFLTTLGMLRVLGYNKRITIIASVLKRAARDLSGFGILFGIIFLGFISTGYVLFYSHIKEFRTLFDVIATLVTYTLGKNHLTEMLLVSPTIAPIYFSLFVFFVTFVLLTMFQAILNTGLVTVRDSLKSGEQPFGIVDILLGIFRSVLTDWFPDSWSKSNIKENKEESGNIQSKNDEESMNTKSKSDEESRNTP